MNVTEVIGQTANQIQKKNKISREKKNNDFESVTQHNKQQKFWWLSSVVSVHMELMSIPSKYLATYRTLPPQNWQSSPCQPSGQTQVPLMHTPLFIQELSLIHFPMTTLLQQNTNIRSTTNKTNKHFRWLCIECNILNIWAKMFSIFDLATFLLMNLFCCCFCDF